MPSKPMQPKQLSICTSQTQTTQYAEHGLRALVKRRPLPTRAHDDGVVVLDRHAPRVPVPDADHELVLVRGGHVDGRVGHPRHALVVQVLHDALCTQDRRHVTSSSAWAPGPQRMGTSCCLVDNPLHNMSTWPRVQVFHDALYALCTMIREQRIGAEMYSGYTTHASGPQQLGPGPLVGVRQEPHARTIRP